MTSGLTAAAEGRSSALGEVARLFLRLGCTAFGGPLAHIAAMEDEVVTKRGWVTRDEFADLVGATNLIPGPNSTELAIHLGYRRAGWPGLVVAGLCFLLPAVGLVWALAWGYTRAVTRVDVAAALAGMQPAVLAVVVQAAWRLRRAFVRSTLSAVLGAVAFLAAVSGMGAFPGGVGAPPVASATMTAATAAAAMSPTAIFWSFARIGSVLFGSGYVLLPFLRAEFGNRLHVLADAPLLDAIAVGQVTPGPVFSAATFVGYLLDGHAGAAAATAGIFLPAFVAVAVTAPFLRTLREHPRIAPVLDVVNAVSLAFMLAAVVALARSVAATPLGLAIFLATSLVLLTTRVGAGWVLLAGGLAGLLRLL